MKSHGVLLVSALALLTACGGKDGTPPTGQVAATVNGKEITVTDIRHEAGTPNPDKALEQAALRSLIIRRLLADEAVSEELDKLPATAIMQEKARQLVLVDALTDKIRKTAPKPSRDEAQQFMSDHPASFAQRRIFLVDQLIIPVNTPELVKALQPLDTMEEIEQMLQKQKVQYQQAVGSIDALSISADAAEKIAALPPGAVFASPEGGIIRVNKVRDTVIQPVTGEMAINVAMAQIGKQRSDAIVANQVEHLLQVGEKSVRYNPAYDPKKPADGKSTARK